MTFLDRRDAGRRLAADVRELPLEHPVVLALPRGGVPVGAEVARALGAPLDVLAVRKLGAPGNPELAVGAIAEDGSALVDRGMARRVGVTDDVLQATLERETAELARRVRAYRGDRAATDVAGRTVVLVDDGLATGLTALAAVRAVRKRGAGRVVVAVPVGSADAVARLGEAADDVVCHAVPPDLRGVGAWYDDFSPVGDAEVVATLAAGAAGAAPRGQPAGKPPDAPASTASRGRPVGAGPPARPAGEPEGVARPVRIDAGGGVLLRGDLVVPAGARGLVLFAHGSGSSRRSPRNRAVAAVLQQAGFATLLLDLLEAGEERDRRKVFDIPLLAGRLERAAAWAATQADTTGLALGFFGASTGAAAALRATAHLGDAVRAVVSRGGRPDLAPEALPVVTAPTLLIVGGDDRDVLALNRAAAARIRATCELSVVEGATHLFEEPGALEAVAELAASWFRAHLAPGRRPLAGSAPRPD